MDTVAYGMMAFLQCAENCQFPEAASKTQQPPEKENDFSNQLKKVADSKEETQSAKQNPETQKQEETQQPAQVVQKDEKGQQLSQELAVSQLLMVDRVVQPQEAVEVETLATPTVVETVQTVSVEAPVETKMVDLTRNSAEETAAPLLPQGGETGTEEETVSVKPLLQNQPETVEKAPVADKTQKAADVSTQTVTEEGDTEVEIENGKLQNPIFRKVEGTPIKVAEAAPQAERPAGQTITQQVTQGLMKAMDLGENRVVLTLNPASLGTVHVEILRDVQGALQVLLSADRMQTRQLLETHAAQLQGMLAERGEDAAQVQVTERTQNEQLDYQEAPDQNPNRGNRSPEGEQDEKSEGNDFMHQLRLGLVDLEGVS